jgi:hypothetical protein
MPQRLNMQLRGLHTDPNPLSEVPIGALLRAQNAVMDREGVVETRRGLKQYMSLPDAAKALFVFQSRILVHHGTTLSYDSDGAGTRVDYAGSYSAPTGANNIRSAEASRNFFFTTSEGVKKLESLTSTPRQAGGIKALDGTAALSGVSGFLPTANQVAYRIVWGYKDANNNLILGAPSQRIVVANGSGGSRDVALAFTIPAGVTTSYFYQVYRSLASGGVAIDASDELALVIEDTPTAGQITALEVTLTDSTPEALRGATLYTSPSQQGIAQSNDAPPLCQDIAFYKNSTLYANTISKQRLFLTMIAVAAPNGVQVGDTITIGGVVYTGAVAENAATGAFLVSTGGTPAENIEATAQSLVRVVNKYASNTAYYAYYLSGFDDLPGRMLIEERVLGGSTIAAISSRGGAYNPELPTSGTTVSSTNDEGKNRVYVSKTLQPEAVPIVNFLDVGSADKDILRIIALRDSVFLLKEDGIYRLTGEDVTTYRVSLFDNTAVLIGADTAVAFNNQIFAYTTQGVVAISDTGVAIMGRAIEFDIQKLTANPFFTSVSFGIAYDSDRKYILFLPSLTSEKAVQASIYNSITGEWTGPWTMERSCGIVNPADNNRLFLGSNDTDSLYVYRERKDFAVSDYADDEVAVTISSSTGTTVVLASTTGLMEGQTLKQSSRESVIDSIDSGTDITVEDDLAWTAGAATAYTPIEVDIRLVPQHANNPGILKQFREITVFFRKANFQTLNIGFRTDLSVGVEEVPVSPITEGPWGGFPWGSVPWGGGDPLVQPIRTWVPREKQRAHWLDLEIVHVNALNVFALAGLSLVYEPMSPRMR